MICNNCYFSILFSILLQSSYLVGHLFSEKANNDKLEFDFMGNILKPVNILVSIGVGSRSHIKPLFEICSVLRSRGHLISYASIEEKKSFNQGYDFNFISLGDVQPPKKVVKKNHVNKKPRKRKDAAAVLAKIFGTMLEENYLAVFPVLSSLVKENRPDVMLCDFFAHACRDVAEVNGIPLIIGVQALDMFGITSESYISNAMDYVPLTINNMSFFERFYDKIIQPLKSLYYFYPCIRKINEFRAKHDIPISFSPFGTFERSLVLANTFEGFESSSPIQPNLKIVGPILSDNFTPLSSDLETFLNSHSRTLYIGFGSRAYLERYDLETIIASALLLIENGTINGVIWGLGQNIKEELPSTITINGVNTSVTELFKENHPKFRILSWAPQAAALNHPNTKMFISHGGMESIVEAIRSGTPILTMGMNGDQFRNGRKVERLGIGLSIDSITTTPEMIRSQVSLILNDELVNLEANMKRAQIMVHFGSRRKSLAANFVEEYVNTARVCRSLNAYKLNEIPCELAHLIPITSHMSFIKSNLIDIYTVALLGSIAILIVISLITRYFMTLALYFISNLRFTKLKQN